MLSLDNITSFCHGICRSLSHPPLQAPFIPDSVGAHSLFASLYTAQLFQLPVAAAASTHIAVNQS